MNFDNLYYMELITKNLLDIREEDLVELVNNPQSFESYQLEYKLEYSGDSDELRRDIIQFTSGEQSGYVFFGINDNPIEIHGIEQDKVDTLKNILNNVLPKKISPMLNPLPEYHPVPLSNGKYVLIVKVQPRLFGIHGLRKSDNMSNIRKYRTFEFYKRLDGDKHQMDVEEVVELIEQKGKLRNLPEIPSSPSIRDERKEMMIAAIKNLTIEYYRKGVLEHHYDSSISEQILHFILMADKLDSGFKEIYAPNRGVSHTNIISHNYGHINVEQFKKMVIDGKIQLETIARTPMVHAGEVAHEIYELFQKEYRTDDILIDDLRREYHELLEENEIPAFRERYNENKFNVSLKILKDHGIIRTTGEYTGKDCLHVYAILNMGRLLQFIEIYSLAVLQ